MIKNLKKLGLEGSRDRDRIGPPGMREKGKEMMISKNKRIISKFGNFSVIVVTSLMLLLKGRFATSEGTLLTTNSLQKVIGRTLLLLGRFYKRNSLLFNDYNFYLVL